MITKDSINQLTDADVYDTEGSKIGSVGQVYVDPQTGDPTWVTAKTGLFGTKESFIPLENATANGDRVTVAYAKDQVKDAPRIEADGPLSSDEEAELYRFYGLQSNFGDSNYQNGDSNYQNGGTNYQSGSSDRGGNSARGTNADRGGRTTGNRDDSSAGYAPGSDDDAMTRSEERLVAGTRTEQAGKARLRKHVVTEQQQVTVPVSHEEVSLQREPITDANRGAAFDGEEISESEHEVTLKAERPVVDTETVPVERVRLGKQTVRDEETVGGQVRKEQVDFDGPDDRR